LGQRPNCIPQSRPRGVKAYGVRYEKALAARLPVAQRGIWWEFVDANGPGYCQTDFIIDLPGGIVILECKYTWVAEGHIQIENLYKPVVEQARGCPVAGLVVVKKLTPGMNGTRVVSSLEEALRLESLGFRVVLHWLGIGPILVPKGPALIKELVS
jgi:hypothetical protein